MARLYRRSRKRADAQALDKLSFLLNDELIVIDNVDPSQTVLAYLRNQKGLTGTKAGCEQGGCGSCTVTVGEMQGAAIRYRSINSCICFLGSLHNKHLITIEGVAKKGKLHPVQQSLYTSHGSQCGFCSPGIVMSLYTLCCDSKADFSGQDICNALDGNLCRCTGYGSVIAASKKLSKRKNLTSFGYDQRTVLAALKKTPYKNDQTFIHKNATYHSPTTSDEVAQLLIKYPRATIMAGGTDIAVKIASKDAVVNRIISLERIQALKMIRKGKDMFAFGAGVTLNDVSTAIENDYPDLHELIRRFGSQQIRNHATVIGNIAGAAPAADMPPALIVLDATLTLRVGHYRRFLKLEDFFINGGKQDIKSGEFIESLQIPRARRSSIYHVYKLSKRFNNDISSICGAFFLMLDSQNFVRDIRICFSGMGAVPKRAANVEQALTQALWNLQSVNSVIPLFEQDYRPASDGRGSAAYRMIAAKNLLKRFYLETQSDTIRTRITGELID